MADNLIFTFRALTIQAVQVKILEEIYQELIKCLETMNPGEEVLEVLKAKVEILFTEKYLNSERDNNLKQCIMMVLEKAMYIPQSFLMFTTGLRQGTIEGLKNNLLMLASTEDVDCQTIAQLFNTSNMSVIDFANAFYDDVIKYQNITEEGQVIKAIDDEAIMKVIRDIKNNPPESRK